MGDDEVRAVALGDVEHLRAHLDAGGRHGKRTQLKFLELLQILDDRDRFATRRVVIKDVGYLLTLELAAELILDELDRSGTLRPISGSDREEISEALAVARSGDAETR